MKYSFSQSNSGHLNLILWLSKERITYIYIYIERERERERHTHTHTHIYVCVCVWELISLPPILIGPCLLSYCNHQFISGFKHWLLYEYWAWLLPPILTLLLSCAKRQLCHHRVITLCGPWPCRVMPLRGHDSSSYINVVTHQWEQKYIHPSHICNPSDLFILQIIEEQVHIIIQVRRFSKQRTQSWIKDLQYTNLRASRLHILLQSQIQFILSEILLHYHAHNSY